MDIKDISNRPWTNEYWQEGFEAFDGGKDINENPWDDVNMRFYHMWRCGFEFARQVELNRQKEKNVKKQVRFDFFKDILNLNVFIQENNICKEDIISITYNGSILQHIIYYWG